MFQILGIDASIDLPITEKFSSSFKDYYGLSSDFLNSNI